MAASRRRTGITARDLVRHPVLPDAADDSGIDLPGPIHDSTSLEAILRLLRTSAVDAIDVVDNDGSLEGTITHHDALEAASRALEELAEERRVLEMAVERQRVALDDAAARVGRIRETLDLALERRRDRSGAGPAVEEALEEIRRILDDRRRD